MAYGAGAAKIAASTGMSVEEVEALSQAEDEMYPEISQYFTDLTERIHKRRQATGITIPHPEIPGIMCALGKSFSTTPSGKKYCYIESPSPEYLAKRGRTSSFSPTQIKNYESQGEGAEFMKAAMWLAVRCFYATKNFNGRAVLLNTVHDALYADAHPDVTSPAFATVHECMAQATDLMRCLFKWDIPLDVPSDTSIGASMAEENKFTPSDEDIQVARRAVAATITAITKRKTQ